MSFWNLLFVWLGDDSVAELDNDFTSQGYDAGCCVNPATGLPMLDGDACGGVDVGGNPYGTDLHDGWSSNGLFDDPWSS